LGRTLLQRINTLLGAALASLLPHRTLKALVANLVNRDATLVLEALGPNLNRKLELDNMPFDLPVQDRLQFENPAGLFASTSLDHGVGVKSDFQKFGRRVRLGGAVLLDDAFDEDIFKTHADTVGRLVEVTARGEFRLARVVNRLAHLERVK
jgi:hypothetical protein